MTPEQIFSICGALAMIGWAGLIFAPRWQPTRDWIAPVIVPLLIGVVYAWLMLVFRDAAPADGGFGSLAAVKSLFAVDQLLLAGWIHYLAFDLFVGAWIVKDSQSQAIHHLAVIPCLLATFMAGPAGLLLYWMLRVGYSSWRNRQVPATTGGAS